MKLICPRCIGSFTSVEPSNFEVISASHCNNFSDSLPLIPKSGMLSFDDISYFELPRHIIASCQSARLWRFDGNGGASISVSLALIDAVESALVEIIMLPIDYRNLLPVFDMQNYSFKVWEMIGYSTCICGLGRGLGRWS